jgi:predicted transcriptional regulator
MNELSLNPNQLSEMLKGRIPRRTIYDFLSGKSDARSEVVSELIRVLGLELTPKNSNKKRAR